MHAGFYAAFAALISSFYAARSERLLRKSKRAAQRSREWHARAQSQAHAR